MKCVWYSAKVREMSERMRFEVNDVLFQLTSFVLQDGANLDEDCLGGTCTAGLEPLRHRK